MSDIHARGNINNMLVILFDLGKIFHSEIHGCSINFMLKNNVTMLCISAILAHLDEIFIVLLDSRHRFFSTSCPIISIKIPEDSSQVQLSGNPANTIINITKCLH